MINTFLSSNRISLEGVHLDCETGPFRKGFVQRKLLLIAPPLVAHTNLCQSRSYRRTKFPENFRTGWFIKIDKHTEQVPGRDNIKHIAQFLGKLSVVEIC